MEEEVKSRIVLISNKRNSTFYVWILGKHMLRDSEESIVFRAQGNDATISVKAAE
jgi:hypothetical protein